MALAEDYEQLTLLTFSDVYADSLAEGPKEAELAFDLLDADGDGLLQIPEMYAYESVRFLRLFPRHVPMD